MFPVTLRGVGVTLREIEERDVPLIHDYASDPEVTRYMTWGPNASLDQTASFARGQIAAARVEPRDAFELVVARASDDELVGRVRLTIESRVHRRADIGYVLRRSCWGNGYGTEAARMIVDFGFRRLSLHRIEATCAPENVASVRVLEKIGMRREGHFRQHILSHGVWRDSLLYAILADQWQGAANPGT